MKPISLRDIYTRFESYIAIFLYELQLNRLRLERFISKFLDRNKRHRVMATACFKFPIYSQSFVYQELTQLSRHGFKVRFLYYHLDLNVQLPLQFKPLWYARRRVILHPGVCERAFYYFKKRMPGKIDRLIDILSRASGMSIQQLTMQYHFMQAFSFVRLVEAYQPNYLHSYFFYEGTLFSFIASFLLDIPRGVSCYADHMLKDYELKLVSFHVEQCKLIIATSERIKQELAGIVGAIDLNKIIVKPNAINITSFPTVDRHEPINGQSYYLTSVSRIEPKKGLSYLVEAVRTLRDQNFNIKLHLIGGVDETEVSKDYAQELNKRINRLKLNGVVFLEGRKSEVEIKQFLAKSHLFVAPFIETETGDKDGIPTSLLEAMATAIPVIATDAGSIHEVIDDGHDGVIVPQRDSNALAAAIADLIKNREGREKLGKNAAKKIRDKFDVTVCEHIFHNRLLEILNHNQGKLYDI